MARGPAGTDTASALAGMHWARAMARRSLGSGSGGRVSKAAGRGCCRSGTDTLGADGQA